MFEHLRASLNRRLATDRTAAQQAVAERDALAASLAQQQATLPQLQSSAAAAQSTLDTRNRDVADAQAVLAQRTSDRQAAQAALDARNRALDDHEQDEPPFHLPGQSGPNPEWVAWNAEEQRLIRLRDQAQDAVDAATSALRQAQQNRDAAVASAAAATDALNRANAAVTAAVAGIADTQQRLVAAAATVTGTQQLVAADQAQLAALADREAALTAQPLDRTAVGVAADAELAEVLSAWQRRHDLLGQRVAAHEARAALLVAHDGIVDDLATLRAEIAAWPDQARWPGLTSVLGALDGAVSADAVQRARPPDERTDDLPGLRDLLAGQVAAVQAVVGQATNERDQDRAALDEVAGQLRDLEADGHP
jgi:hypothetical protein